VLNPLVLPKIGGPVTRRFVEGAISGAVGGGCYVLAWPYKKLISNQRVVKAYKQCIDMTPKVFLKKVSYAASRPHLVRLLK
jgi:hypothetical protein